MMKPLFIKNAPIDEKRIDHIETVVSRLTRHERKTVPIMITPYPISNAIIGGKVIGDVLHYMFPCDGKIIKSAIDLGKKPKQTILVTVNLLGEAGGQSVSAIMDKRRVVIEPNIEVTTFDKLTVSISYKEEKPEDALTEFWISILWSPTIKDIVAKSFLLSELDKDDLSKE